MPNRTNSLGAKQATTIMGAERAAHRCLIPLTTGNVSRPLPWISPSGLLTPHVIGVGQTIAVEIGWIGAMILIRRLLAPNHYPLVGSRVTP